MFPFKTLTLYKIKKDFVSSRSEDEFKKDQQVTYLSSTANVHELIEICLFQDFHTNKKLIWHADELDLEKWNDLFEIIPFPK
jgi:hypothetical protein